MPTKTPEVRRTFAEALAKHGLTPRMDPIAYEAELADLPPSPARSVALKGRDRFPTSSFRGARQREPGIQFFFAKKIPGVSPHPQMTRTGKPEIGFR